MLLRTLLPFLLLSAAPAGAYAQGTLTPPAPPLTPPPTTAETGRLQGREAKTVDPSETVTLDTTAVQLRVDPRTPGARARPVPAPKPRPRH